MHMVRYRSLSSLAGVVVVCAVLGGVLGRSSVVAQDQVAEQYKVFTAALSAVEVDLRRRGPVGPAGLRGHHRDAPDARPAFELHGPEELRPDARAPGRALLRPRASPFRSSAATSPWSTCSRARRPTSAACAAATSSPRSRATTPRAGRATRPSASCAARAARAVGISLRRAGYDKLIDLKVHARRDSHARRCPPCSCSTPPPATSASRTSARTPTRSSGSALGALTKRGHEAAGVRPARQPRRRARSGHQGVQPVPAARRHDRLHARPRAELRSGLPRHGAERLPAHPDGDAGQPQQRQRVGNRVGRAAGSRSLAHRRRDHVRQGARAVGVPREPERGRGHHDRALLHAERPADSAAVGRHLRRVPHLHAARAGPEQARTSPRT